MMFTLSNRFIIGRCLAYVSLNSSVPDTVNPTLSNACPVARAKNTGTTRFIFDGRNARCFKLFLNVTTASLRPELLLEIADEEMRVEKKKNSSLKFP